MKEFFFFAFILQSNRSAMLSSGHGRMKVPRVSLCELVFVVFSLATRNAHKLL